MLAALLLSLQDSQRILDAFERARPKDDTLSIYRLDWAEDVKSALARAAKEGRPVLVVATEQTEDAGSLKSGHC